MIWGQAGVTSMNFEGLLRFGVDQGSSDIHLQAGQPAMLRIHGQLRGVEGAVPEDAELREFLIGLAPPEIAADFDRALRRARVYSGTRPGLARLRCALALQAGRPGAALRIIPEAIPAVASLNLPDAIHDVALSRRGLTLVVGGAGSGRSTTLAVIVDMLNRSFPSKIITVEEPVEFVHASDRAMVVQWEVGRDTPSRRAGLRAALRQDADILVVDGLNGSALIRLALRAVESGRRVVAVVDGSTTVQAIERILAVVPPGERSTVSWQLAHSIDAIIAQRLATTRDGQRRPVFEILRGGPMVTQSIQENRLKDLRMLLTGRQGGMQTFDQHIVELHQEGLLSGTEAMRLSTSPELVASELRTRRAGRPA